MNLTIANTAVRQAEGGLYCLSDLHKAAGGLPKHQPAQWLRSQQTKDLIAELQNSGIPLFGQSTMGIPIVVKNGGKDRGTYVCKELVYSCAMWISAIFHLKVIRAYDALMTAPEAGANTDSLFDELLTCVDELRIELIETQRDLIHHLRQAQAAPRAQVLTKVVERVPVEIVERMEAADIPREEIANLTGRTYNAVRQIVFRARRRGRLN